MIVIGYFYWQRLKIKRVVAFLKCTRLIPFEVEIITKMLVGFTLKFV